MATLLPLPTTSSSRKFHSLKVDMTPMVDLGFLLITFFIFTATLSQPGVTKLIMPKESKDWMDVPKSKAMTLLLDKEKVFVYEGRWEDAFANRKIVTGSYDLQSGVGRLLREKQTRLPKKDLVVVIKPFATASYQNVIAALDEMQINNIKQYAIVEATTEEKLIR